MLFKVLFFVLLLSLVKAQKIKRCCKTGGLIHYVNGTISCIPALLPNSLNEEPLLLSVTQDQASKYFKNDNPNFVCREIVFDEQTGLVMRSLINVSSSASFEGKFVPKSQYEIKKCCNDDSYIRFNITTGNGCCVQREDKEKYKYVMQKFPQYYKNDRTYDCNTLNCTDPGCRDHVCNEYYPTNDDLNIFVLGDEVLESRLFQHPLIQYIKNELKFMNYCSHSQKDPQYTLHLWCHEETTRYKILNAGKKKVFMEVTVRADELERESKKVDELEERIRIQQSQCEESIGKQEEIIRDLERNT